MKLANYENRDVDIENLVYAWTMYYQRKDYSVYTIDHAFIAFEEEKLVDEDESFEIISRLMEQSEKGDIFTDSNNLVRFWELDPLLMDNFNKKDMSKQLTELLGCHYSSRYIEYRDIANVMKSKYRDMVLDGIEYYGFSILSPINNLQTELELRGIKYFADTEEDENKYIPLNYGCLHEEDFTYIREKKIGYMDVAQYTDGWYSCLPYIDVFTLFNKDDIQQDYLNILYEAIFARCPDKTYIESWHLLIGNIVEFLKQYEINVDYSKLYSILINFLDVSLIWHET